MLMRRTATAKTRCLPTKPPDRGLRVERENQNPADLAGFCLWGLNLFSIDDDLDALARPDVGARIEAVQDSESLLRAIDALHAV